MFLDWRTSKGLLKGFWRTSEGLLKDFWRTSEGLLKDFLVYKNFTSRSPQVFKTCWFLFDYLFDRVSGCPGYLWIRVSQHAERTIWQRIRYKGYKGSYCRTTMPNYVYNYCSFTLNSAGLSKQSQHCQLLVISLPAFISLEDLDVLIVQSCNVHVFTCVLCV